MHTMHTVHTVHASAKRYDVQTRLPHQRWVTRWSFSTLAQALRWYESLNTFGDYRKRLVAHDGEVIFSSHPTVSPSR